MRAMTCRSPGSIQSVSPARSRGEESELAHPENRYLANLNVLYRPWIMKSGFPYLIVDTEAIDFRTEEGLERVVEGIVSSVPGTRELFD